MLKQLVKDNEETVRINKEMLSIILADVNDIPDKHKATLEKMNKENQSLIER